MAKTKIQWAETVWNPTIGCTRVSEGCRNCYAERMAVRLVAMGRREYENTLTSAGRWNGNVKLVEERLSQPLSWKKPRRVFVDSMSDLFHPDVPVDYIANVWAIMRMAEQHIYMILTKRPERMYQVLTSAEFEREYRECVDILTEHTFTGGVLPLANIWLGVSVEHQAAADERIPLLMDTPAAVRFVSAEPLLGPVDLNDLHCGDWQWDAMRGYHWKMDHSDHQAGTVKLNWVICGGESGPNARPMHPDWARSLRDQCQDAGVPYFFKQWGEFIEVSQEEAEATREGRHLGFPPRVVMFGSDVDTVYMKRVGKHAAINLNLLDGKAWEEYP